MSITYRPPFDEDDERDLRALYRKPGPGTSPELDAAVRRRWHPGHSWHPGWGAAACAAMVAGLFAWTDLRESAEPSDLNTQLIAPEEPSNSPDPAPTPAPVLKDAQPAAPAIQRAMDQQPGAPASQAKPEQEADTEEANTEEANTAVGAQTRDEAPQAQMAAFTEQDIEARVAQIRALIVNDREAEAVQALRELQQGAPSLALPDDLLELDRQNPA